jgi:DNA-binding transcriptional MocR family regulator
MARQAQVRSWSPPYAPRAARMRASEIRELLKLVEQPGIISFAGGIPDPALFPLADTRAACAGILDDDVLASACLQYSVSEGYLPLRTWIAEHASAQGVPCSPDNIVITSGSQQGLEFLGRLLLSPGDTALVTAPTYLGALQAFSTYEPRYDELRPEGGNRTSQSYLEAALAVRSQIKLAYVVPSFANPTGETLSLEGRERLLDLVDALDIALIEDTAYAALRFGEIGPPSLLALEVARRGSLDQARVVQCGTFSKVLSPGLRVGWIVASRAMIRRLVLVKQATDLHSATLNQIVMHRLAVAGYDAQARRASHHYRARRDAMLAALAAHMPPGTQWTRPDGGFFVWVTLPDGTDAAALLQRSVAEAGVAFVPGSAFFHDCRGRNTLRLSYSLVDEDTIDSGIRRLAALLCAQLNLL